MRTVEVSPFDIAAHTVTNAQFGEFVRRTGFETDAERLNWSFVFSAFVGEEVKRRVQRVPADTPWCFQFRARIGSSRRGRGAPR
jgi:formylglycine-generating enzyme required for sulfatase activity